MDFQGGVARIRRNDLQRVGRLGVGAFWTRDFGGAKTSDSDAAEGHAEIHGFLILYDFV